MMPKMCGFELYEHLKKIDPYVQVCFLTASEMYHLKVSEVEHCAWSEDLFVVEPFNPKIALNYINFGQYIVTILSFITIMNPSNRRRS